MPPVPIGRERASHMTTPIDGRVSLENLYARTTVDEPTSGNAAPPVEVTGAEPQGAPPAPAVEPKPEQMVPLKAHRDEVRKRQNLERELADLRANVPNGEPRSSTTPDPIVDPEAYTQYIENRGFVRLVEASRADMIDEVGEDDFLAKEDAFMAAAHADPKLTERLRNSRDPGKLAYTLGKKILETPPPVDDVAVLRAELAELRAAMGQSPVAPAGPPAAQVLTTPARPQAPARPALPTSLAGMQSAAPRTGAQPVTRRPIGSILGG